MYKGAANAQTPKCIAPKVKNVPRTPRVETALFVTNEKMKPGINKGSLTVVYQKSFWKSLVR